VSPSAASSSAAAPAPSTTPTTLAATGTTTTNYLALVPLFFAVGGLFVWLARGRRSEAELQ
jgi:LPXTG-motif cell wall-anchored protein